MRREIVSGARGSPPCGSVTTMLRSALLIFLALVSSAAACKREDEKMTPQECSDMAENVATIVGVPAMKQGLYADCKEAEPEKWALMRCLKDAKSLADLDVCKEKAPAAPPEAQAEARVSLASLFDAIGEFFAKEHEGSPPHRCAGYDMLKDQRGDSGIVPPLSVDCSGGPEGKCVPTSSPSKPWEYDASAWGNNPVFGRIGFEKTEPHRFHYSVRAENYLDNAYGACQFTAQAFGDLDGDGVFSTFERSGAADANGLNGSAGLYIDLELE